MTTRRKTARKGRVQGQQVERQKRKGRGLVEQETRKVKRGICAISGLKTGSAQVFRSA